jgi:hypothetical protein
MKGLDLSRAFGDGYTSNARLKPALLALVPVIALVSVLGFRSSVAIGVWSGFATTLGLTFLLAEIGRDRGKREQQALFRMWGGNPCVLKLRHRDSSLNFLTLERYHSAGGRLLGRPLPDPIQEARDPEIADIVYGSLVDMLRERTRDKKRFPLLFGELVSYGFRRNLWGLKPFALWTVAAAAVFQVALFAFEIRVRGHADSSLIWLTVADCLIGLFWIRVVKPSWVKIVSDSYAERLLATAEILSPMPGRGQPAQQEAKIGHRARTGPRTTTRAKKSVRDEERPSSAS